MDAMNELGFYALAGAAKSPRDLITECREAEAMGLGSVFLSERFNVKEALTSCGALAVASSVLGIGTAATNHHTRHPIVTAAHATTMHRLSGGRYMLGLGRGVSLMTAALGLPAVTTEQMEAFTLLMRRLWRGERVLGYDGVLGKYPQLALDPSFDENIPIGVTAFGPKMLEMAGRVCDAVILHTFFTDETTVRAVRTVRKAAEQAGRDPARIRVWSVFATVGDHLSPEARLKKTVGRLATYLQAYGDLMVETNRWDPAVLQSFRKDTVVAGMKGLIDAVATIEELQHIAKLIPEEWLAPAAVGTPEACARAIRAQFDLGIDSVILHGATPTELAPIVEAYRLQRLQKGILSLPANPGHLF